MPDWFLGFFYTESKRFTLKASVLPDAGNLMLFARLGLEVEVPSLRWLASQPCFPTCFSRCKSCFHTISYNRSVGLINVRASVGNGKPMQKSMETHAEKSMLCTYIHMNDIKWRHNFIMHTFCMRKSKPLKAKQYQRNLAGVIRG